MAYTVDEMFIGMEHYRWYNVTSSVGRGAANHYDDVCLVQLLLSYLRPYVPNLQKAALKPMRVDGICGPVTQSYIDAYANSLAVAGGKIDPGFKHGAYMLIWAMNRWLYEKAPAAHEGIPEDVRTPAVLRQSLRHVV